MLDRRRFLLALLSGTSPFAFGGFEPTYLLDFVNDPSGAESALTFSRASAAMMRNSSGVWVSVAIGEPRIGHHEWNGSEWVNKGLLKEDQATNGLEYSTDLTDSTWVKSNATVISGEVSQFGVNSAEISAVSGGSASYAFVPSQTSSLVQHCMWVIAKSGTNEFVQIVGSTGTFTSQTYATFSLEDGAVGSTGISVIDAGTIGLGGGWWLCYVVATPNSTGTNFSTVIAVVDSISAARLSSVALAGASVQIAHAQIEVGAEPTSPIQTSGSAVTRAADVMTQPPGTLPWTASALSLFMSGEVSGDSYTLLSWQVDANNRITHTLNTSDFTFTQAAAGTVDSITGGSHASGLSVPFAYAATHTSSGIYAAVNGVALTPDETPTALADLTGATTSLLPSGNYTIAAIAGWAVDIGDTGRLEGSNYGN